MIINTAIYVVKVKFNKAVFKLFFSVLRFLESKKKPRFGEIYTDVIKNPIF